MTMELDGHKFWVILRAVIMVAIGVYLILAILLTLFQSHFVYYPTHVLDNNPSNVGLMYEAVSIQSEDGVRLLGWYIPCDSARATVLLCHGNGGNISHRVSLIKILHDLKLNVLIFDYRGYGQSEGEPSEMGTYKDAKAAWLYLVRKKDINPSNIIIHGRSLGGAVAAHLAREVNPGGLILESTFTSAGDIAARMFPYFPIRLMIHYRYNTADDLAHCTCPVLIVHSRNDKLIPIKFGRELYKIAHEPKTFLEITGTHDDGYFTSGQTYIQGLDKFIDAVTTKSTGE